MKKIIFLIVLMSSAKTSVYSQEHVRIINAQAVAQFLKVENGKASTAIRNVKVKVEYWTDNKSGAADKQFIFVVASASAAAGAGPSISMNPVTIKKDDFDTDHDTAEYDVPVTIKAIAAFKAEFFTIGIKEPDAAGTLLDESTGGSTGVALQKGQVDEEALETPFGFTYLNAVNFDFKESGSASYVGHLNVYQPYLYKKIGINCGIFKTDFSRQDSSLDGTRDFAANVHINPLDSVKVGNRYLRQYNKLSVVSKNVTWSFYLQPLYRVIDRTNFKFYIHGHIEFYVDKWNITSTLTNYQQDTSFITADNISVLRDSIDNVNAFQKSTTEPVVSKTNSTKVNFNLGIGITIDAKLWDSGNLFVQFTVGKAIDYARPLAINPQTLKSIETNDATYKGKIAHLTRIVLTQKLTANMQALIGVDVRGIWGNNPTYSTYIGVNLGLAGLKKLINGA